MHMTGPLEDLPKWKFLPRLRLELMTKTFKRFALFIYFFINLGHTNISLCSIFWYCTFPSIVILKDNEPLQIHKGPHWVM